MFWNDSTYSFRLYMLAEPYKLTVNVVSSTMKEWFHSLTVPAFQIIFLLFFFFRELRVGIRKEKKSIWKTMNLLLYDPGVEQNQKWSPHADRIKCNLLESSSRVILQGAQVLKDSEFLKCLWYCAMVISITSEVRWTLVQILALPYINCVTLGKL